MPWETNPGSQEQDMRSPANSATSATSLLYGANMSICGLFLHATLVNFYYSANKWDWTNTTESGCVPENSQHGNRYDYVAKTPRDVELENDIVWKLVVARPRCVFRHPRRIFLKNFESHRRELGESPQEIIFACEFDM